MRLQLWLTIKASALMELRRGAPFIPSKMLKLTRCSMDVWLHIEDRTKKLTVYRTWFRFDSFLVSKLKTSMFAISHLYNWNKFLFFAQTCYATIIKRTLLIFLFSKFRIVALSKKQEDSFLNFLTFLCSTVYIVEKDAHLCGPLIRLGTVEVGRKVSETNVSIFFFLLYPQEWSGSRMLLAVQSHQHPGMGNVLW